MPKISKREKQALVKLWEKRPAANPDDFYPADAISGAGPVTINSLLDKGMIERGPSKRHHTQNGIRLTKLGEKAAFE